MDEDTLDAQATGNDGTDSEVPAGVQARIDELTGKFRGMERSVQEKDQQILQLTNRLLEVTGQKAAPQADPLDELLKDTDPEDVRRMDAVIQKRMAPMLQRLEQLTGQLHESRAQNALGQVEDPEVRQHAQRLIQGWRQKGVYGTVATEEDAILMAEGIVAKERRNKPDAERERRAFNDAEQPLSGVRAAQPGARKRGVVDLSGFDADQLAAKLRENPALEDQLGDFEF